MIDSNDCLGSPPSEDAATPEGLAEETRRNGDYKGAALILFAHRLSEHWDCDGE